MTKRFHICKWEFLAIAMIEEIAYAQGGQVYFDFIGINWYELVFVANIGFFLALLNFSSGIIDAYLT